MKMMAFSICLMLLVGCEPVAKAILDPPIVSGKVELTKIDGQVTKVDLSLFQGRVMRDRHTVDKQINALKKLVTALESARDEMPVTEPPPVQQIIDINSNTTTEGQ